jgi:hypothetical protein
MPSNDRNSRAIHPNPLLILDRSISLRHTTIFIEERTTMTRLTLKMASWMMVVLALGIYGCGPAADSTPSDMAAPSEGSEDHGDHEHEEGDHEHEEGDHEHEEGDGEHEEGDGDDAEASINKLPEADQLLARAQKICPVGGGALGEMGMPIKVDLDGRAVFVCCDHCIEDLKADPAKFLAKLDAPAGEADAQ